ncbi:type II toxin-antitoxin system VapC family toxin [Sandarakinorhabdus sp.]|uniref:type II toxin-antitoxin system VapC family toxin n=1 Tax=Sandarakinorhabdus sp. TaxID=1916663 RepID=UPI00286E2598|nr:type II toxin-antitoxin system VapC family toxin [Sandarakinorhabdus sp.]
MMIFADTNVWSEVTKPRPDPAVMEWHRRNDGQTLLSVVVIGEIEQGIAMTSGPEKRRVLKVWLANLVAEHAGRIVPFDEPAARRWGQICATARLAGRSLPLVDTMLAAQALCHGAVLATRNVRDFGVEGLTVIDPWSN